MKRFNYFRINHFNMTKTITLEEQTEKGKYILFSGEERKRKYDFFGYSDKMHFPTKKQTTPYVELFLREKDEVRCVFNYLIEDMPNGLFGRSFKNEGDENHILIKGQNLINTYRVFEIMNQAKKIPCEPSYVGGGILGDAIPRGTYIEEEVYYKTLNELKEKTSLKEAIEWKFNFLGDSYTINYLTYIHKKTRIPKRKIKKIEQAHPSDDSKQIIRENDLVKIVMKS